MKKIFLLASVALCFAACNNEAEEIENNNAEITRSHVIGGVCDHFPGCQFELEGRTELDHFHCLAPSCSGNSYFMTGAEAWAHCQANHGGAFVYE